MKTVTIEICMGSACYLLGAQELIEMIQALPEEIQEQIDLRGSTCLKACGQGPNITVDGELVHNVTTDLLRQILEEKLGVELG